MEAYFQKLWEKSYELIQMRIKIAQYSKFHDFSQKYSQQNDVIRRYTILFILFLATKTDHKVTRKRKLLSFSDSFLFYSNKEIRTQNVANLTFYDVIVTS